jgi:hypothetical protein
LALDGFGGNQKRFRFIEEAPATEIVLAFPHLGVHVLVCLEIVTWGTKNLE